MFTLVSIKSCFLVLANKKTPNNQSPKKPNQNTHKAPELEAQNKSTPEFSKEYF